MTFLELALILGLLLWLPLSLVIGRHRGWNLLHAGILGVLLGPLGLLIIAVVTGPNPTTAERDEDRQREYWRRYWQEREEWERDRSRPVRSGRRR